MTISWLARRAPALIVYAILAVFTADALAQAPVPRPTKRGRKYKVRIDSAPQGAALYLDDKKYGILGYTPWEGGLVKGDHVIILEHKGYEAATRTINVRRTRRLQETFVPMVKKEEPAKLEVRADADRNAFGAQVWVDGQMQGQIPVTLTVDDGRHLVEVKKDEFEPFSQWIEAKEGERVTINPMLRAIEKKQVGSVLITADVGEAEIYIDGNKIDSVAPARVDNILAGPHVIEVRKPPAMPWRQTVNVEPGKVITVAAELKATLGGAGGSVRVLSNVDGAKVYLDGTEMGTVPLDIKDVKPGEHVVEVKAKGYQTREERITVGAGSASVLKLDMNAATGGGPGGVIKIVSPVPEAEVAIDGEVIGNAPQEKELSAGDHFVVVRKAGFRQFEKKVRLEPGQTLTITAQLAAAGGLRVFSTPSGATVFVDGEEVGKTPYNDDDIEAGEHVISVRADDYYAFEKTVNVGGGERSVVQARLELIDTGPTPGELQSEQRGLTSYGARAMPRGRSTIDMAMGYPYFLDGRITVGAGDIGSFAFDAGLLFRTYFSRTELGLTGRLTLADHSPFSAGAFAVVGGGGNLFDDSGRNSFLFNAGVMASLTGLSNVTITGRTYLDVWSDSHCPEVLPDGSFMGDAITVCEQYQAFVSGGDSGDFGQDDKDRIDQLLGGDDLFGRDNGARLMFSLAVEVAVKQRWNVFALFEGAPFQEEKAAYTDPFNAALFDEDIGTYFRLGTTYKF